MPVAAVPRVQQVIDAPVVVEIGEAGELPSSTSSRWKSARTSAAPSLRALSPLGRPSRRNAAASVARV